MYFSENKSIYKVFIKLRERKDTGNRKTKHCITLFVEIALEGAMDLS